MIHTFFFSVSCIHDTYTRYMIRCKKLNVYVYITMSTSWFPSDPNILLCIAGDDPQIFQVLSLINTELSKIFNIGEYWKRFPFAPDHKFKTPQDFQCLCGKKYRTVFGINDMRFLLPNVFTPDDLFTFTGRSGRTYIRLGDPHLSYNIGIPRTISMFSYRYRPQLISRSVIRSDPAIFEHSEESARISRVEDMIRTLFKVEFKGSNPFKPVTIQAPTSKRKLVQTFTRASRNFRDFRNSRNSRKSYARAPQYDKRLPKRKWMTKH